MLFDVMISSRTRETRNHQSKGEEMIDSEKETQDAR
jgi:hypothetical protein